MPGSAESVDQFGQSRNLTAGGRFVDHAFSRAFIDAGDRFFQGLLCKFLVAGCNGLANSFNQVAHGSANVVVACMTDVILFVALDCRFMVSHFFLLLLRRCSAAD